MIRVQEQGVRLVLASGRPTYGIVPLANELRMNEFGGFILSYNGGEIINWETQEMLYENVLPNDVVPVLYECARSHQSVSYTHLGLAKACSETGAQVSEYSAAPVFMDEHAKCRHQWLIEFAKMPDSVEKFAAILDATLKEVNSDYEAKRWKDIALQPLEVIVARPGLFHDWLAQRGKLGGQHKVPRLSNTREYIETMLALNSSPQI